MLIKRWQNLWLAIPAAALILLLTAALLTRSAMRQVKFGDPDAASENLVDLTPWETASTLARLASSAEEQNLAHEAERMADHEVDQAFAMALRQASLEHPAMTPGALALQTKIMELRSRVAEDKARAEQLTEAAKAAGTEPAEGDEADVARAQLALENDELSDAVADFARVSGDTRGRIEAELQAHEAAIKKVGEPTSEPAVQAVQKNDTLRSRLGAWFQQRERGALVREARDAALADSSKLRQQHDALERRSSVAPPIETTPAANNAQTAAGRGRATVRALEQRSGEKAIQSILDDRIETESHLANIYGKWQQQIEVQHRILNHLLLASFSAVVFVVLLAAIARRVGFGLLTRISADARRRRTLGTILTLGINVLAGLVILVLVLGPPQQVPTILGLTTAGLTVVFQDFILAFFGWFVLMGRNGIRVGDWVEIDGVSGEVAEIGLFRTVLLEAGNWTSRGHPTGRRLSSINSFAFRGKYFNFSTHGQWMWDEITLTVPSALGFAVLGEMQKQLADTVAADTVQANQELARAHGQNLIGEFTAEPTVDLRPASAGIDIVVRFVTRAGQRFEVRNKLYDAMLRIVQAQQQREQGAAELAPASE